MTDIEMMAEEIGRFCNERICSECILKEVCTECNGHFTAYPTACEKAYEIINGLKKIKCSVCGFSFIPKASIHYVARNDVKKGLSTVVTQEEPNIYDAFDCPSCGCQIIAQERKRRDESNETMVIEKETDEEC